MTHDVAGRHVVALDLDGVADKAGLMERCVRALELPDWFGRNWDALADSLGDTSVWPAPAVEKGLLVVVTGWQPYANARPQEWLSSATGSLGSVAGKRPTGQASRLARRVTVMCVMLS